MDNISKISVIITCYNQGLFIEQAINSVISQTIQDFEIIIVDDGSKDENTIKFLHNYHQNKTKIYFTENNGVVEARNFGIKQSIGKYILTLDADDYIDKDYFKEAIKILDNNPEIGIVGCKVKKFGKENNILEQEECSLENILVHNMFVCASFFRKQDWEKIGGYNPNMVYGWEDWDFWISIIGLGKKGYRIPKVLFFYRVQENSRSTNMAANEDKLKEMYLQIFINHKSLYFNNIETIIKEFYLYRMDSVEFRKLKYNLIYIYLRNFYRIIKNINSNIKLKISKLYDE